MTGGFGTIISILGATYRSKIYILAKMKLHTQKNFDVKYMCLL